MATVLADVGRINMMFTVQEGTCGHDLRCLGTDGDPGGLSPGALAAEVERTRTQLGAQFGRDGSAVEWRVAASLFHQSLANRILSPVIAAALCHGVLLDARRLYWDPDRAGGLVLHIDQEHTVTGPAADWIEKTVLDPRSGVMGRAEHALTGVGRIAPGLLRGNVGSALAGAVGALARARPTHRARAEALADDLLSRPGTGLSGTFTDPTGFRRTTCCLYYRLPGGGTCGDCVLRTHDR